MLSQLVQMSAQSVSAVGLPARGGVGLSAALDNAVGSVSAQHGVGLSATSKAGMSVALDNAVGSPGHFMPVMVRGELVIVSSD